MGKNRLEAFSDGVLAIVITIMVLERFAGQCRGRVRARRDAVLGAARRADWVSVRAPQQRNASLLARTRRAAPRTGRLRCWQGDAESSLP